MPPTFQRERGGDVRIHHSRPGSGFARIPNDALRDERLSFAARGHLAYLLSLPDGWSTTADSEAKRARQLRGRRGEGNVAMRGVYAELKAAGYVFYHRAPDNGKWMTTIHVGDRPRTEAQWKAVIAPGRTDVRLTDVPETRTSVPPAETESSQVAPMYGSPGVGTPAVGTPMHREAVRSYEDGSRNYEDEDPLSRVGDVVDDWGARGNHPREEQPIANPLARVHDGPVNGADDAQHLGDATTVQIPAADRNARASESNGLANGHASEHQRNELERLAAWMRENPESMT